MELSSRQLDNRKATRNSKNSACEKDSCSGILRTESLPKIITKELVIAMKSLVNVVSSTCIAIVGLSVAALALGTFVT